MFVKKYSQIKNPTSYRPTKPKKYLENKNATKTQTIIWLTNVLEKYSTHEYSEKKSTIEEQNLD